MEKTFKYTILIIFSTLCLYWVIKAYQDFEEKQEIISQTNPISVNIISKEYSAKSSSKCDVIYNDKIYKGVEFSENQIKNNNERYSDYFYYDEKNDNVFFKFNNSKRWIIIAIGLFIFSIVLWFLVLKKRLMKHFIYIFIIFIYSCSKNSKTTQESYANDSQKDTVDGNRNVKNISKDSNAGITRDTIYNEAFANAPLKDFIFEHHDLPNKFIGTYTISKKSKKNMYNDKWDTLITFQRNNSVVRFYKSPNKIVLDSLNVSDSKFIKMDRNIDIGIAKSEFLEKFNEKNDNYSDTIYVTNEELNNTIQFIFKNDKLENIFILPW